MSNFITKRIFIRPRDYLHAARNTVGRKSSRHIDHRHPVQKTEDGSQKPPRVRIDLGAIDYRHVFGGIVVRRD